MEHIVIVKNIANKNTDTLRKISVDETYSAQLEDAKKIIKISIASTSPSPDFVTHWEESIKNEKINNTFKKTEKYKELGKIMDAGLIDLTAWSKINTILNIKRKAEIWTPGPEKSEVVAGFRKLYNCVGKKKLSLNEFGEMIMNVINQASKYNNILVKTSSTYIPKSKARDLNGFSQRDIIHIIKGENTHQDLLNLTTLLYRLWSNSGRTLFFHRTSKVILFKKLQEIRDFRDTRPISIIPAVIMVMQKIISPIIKEIIKGKINKYQFGFKVDSDINSAKLYLAYIMYKNGFKRALLIDLRKACDLVNIENLIKIIDEKFSNNEAEQLKSILYLYQKMNMSIQGEKIEPSNGLPQGDPHSPTFFNIFIDPIIANTNRDHTNIHCQAYADDMIVAGNDDSEIQIVFNKMDKNIREVGLEINPDKCEYLSDDETTLLHESTGTSISSSDKAKYLGQELDNEGKAYYNISKRDFGKIIEIFKVTTCLSRKARIKIFKCYARGKIGHLIPFIAVSQKIEDSWKRIRSIIFNNILAKSTFPKESAALFKISFFDIIIKPMMKIVEKLEHNTDDLDYINFIKESIMECFKTWLTIEDHWSTKIKNMIADTLERKKFYTSTTWAENIREEAARRLFRNCDDFRNVIPIKNLQEPDVILYMSNAPSHIIHERVKYYYKTMDEAQRNAESAAINEIIMRYMLGIHLCENKIQTNYYTTGEWSTNTYIEYYSILEARVLEIIETNQEFIHKNCVIITTEIIETNIDVQDNREYYNETRKIRDLIEKFREKIINSEKETWETVEIMLNHQLKKPYNNLKIEKKKPGRPPNKKEVKDKNQMTLDDFVI